jgi:hypothetical protein
MKATPVPVKPHAIVRTAVIEAVAKWASTSDAHTHIRQVLFDKKQGQIVACDGHRLVAVPDPEVIRQFGIERDHLLTAVAAAHSAKAGTLEFRVVEGTVHIKITQQITMVVPETDSDSFPPYGPILNVEPATTPPTGYIFDTRYLAAIQEVDDATCGRRAGLQITGWVGDKLNAMIFKSSAGVQFAVMPMNGFRHQEK